MIKDRPTGNSLSTYVSKERLKKLCEEAKKSGKDSVKIADIEEIFGWDR